jgi:ribonuclease BN (tRNA processing enzyme)
MRVELIPSGVDGSLNGQVVATTLVDDELAVDAGSLGLLPLERQKQVRNVLLTHSHLDHIATLPIFIDHVFVPGQPPATVFGSSETIAALRSHVFNDSLWPDVSKLIANEADYMVLRSISAGSPLTIGRHAVTAFPLTHPAPTFGYHVDDGRDAVAFLSDTSDAATDLVSRLPRLRAVFLEASFPKSMAWLAGASGHLTSAQFLDAACQFPPDVRVIPVHIKLKYASEIHDELKSAGLSNVDVPTPGRVFEFRV